MRLTEKWTQMYPHPLQRRLYLTQARRVWIVAGRGSGKSEVTKRRAVREMFTKQLSASPLFAYILPTHQQAMRVAWKDFVGLIPKERVTGVNVTQGTITVDSGATLYVQGADRPERLEGVQWTMAFVDERSDQKPELISETLIPALTHNRGRLWQLGVPKRKGVGAASFKEGWEKALHDETGYSEAYHWTSQTVLKYVDPEAVDRGREELSAKDFNEHYNASWETDSGRVYCDYGPENLDFCIYDPSRTIYVGCDFNVTPMSWLLAHLIDDELYIFAEVSLEDTTTRKTLDYLHQRYASHPAGWAFIGDAAGRARKTATTMTDYLHIQQDDRFSPKRVMFDRSNPPIFDRVRNTNAAFCSASGRRRVHINKNCKKLIRDLDSIYYIDGTGEIFVPKGLGHMVDALGYLVWHTIPVGLKRPTAGPVIVSGN